MTGQPLSEDREYEEDEALLEPEQPDEAELAETEREAVASETKTMPPASRLRRASGPVPRWIVG